MYSIPDTLFISTDFSLPIKDAASSDSWWWVCCRGMKEILSEAMPVQNQNPSQRRQNERVTFILTLERIQVSFEHNRANFTVFRETELKQSGQSKCEKHQRLIFSANILQLHIHDYNSSFNVPSSNQFTARKRNNVRQNGVHQNTSDRTAFLNPTRFGIFEESKHNSRHDSFRFPRGNRCRIRAGAVTIKRSSKKYQSCMGLPTIRHDVSEEFEILYIITDYCLLRRIRYGKKVIEHLIAYLEEFHVH
ncbi:hypothetical protein G5I_08524 [Acromyrmex echinatior]|uniref:Uncharacterized protein n=1 Tax=Acromyrmex echinatior TaxID=103372 RepID=F4WRS1_ACREC|nr:hypothetical protein G5I_08524 [Acromyrmex echinatior]